MEKILTIKDLQKSIKIEQRKAQLRKKLDNIGQWVYRNKELVMIFGPVVIGGAVSIAKGTVKHINLHKEESIKNLYCYDRSLGHYWKLRRELSNAEWVEIDRRKRNGEKLADILDQLKVLK